MELLEASCAGQGRSDLEGDATGRTPYTPAMSAENVSSTAMSYSERERRLGRFVRGAGAVPRGAGPSGSRAGGCE